MILGARCTRSCRFCAVEAGRAGPVDPEEPGRVAAAVRRLGLLHAVITSVARDDLPDEGAGQFVEVLQAVRRVSPDTTAEVLVPDFHDRAELIHHVVTAGRPAVFAHNVETVERLSPLVRPQAAYRRSLAVLRRVAAMGQTVVKSSLMVGLGETPEEIRQTFEDLRAAGVTHVTIGQYLRPDAEHLPVMEYVSPARFQAYERSAREAGFVWVKAGPFVRSSYHAVEAMTRQEPAETPWRAVTRPP
jgi:lipoic acid synthetase